MLYEVVFEPHGVHCTYIGKASIYDGMDALSQYLKHPDCAKFRYVMHDFTRVDSFMFEKNSFATVVGYAYKNYQSNDYVPRIAIAASDVLMRTLEMYSELTGRQWIFFTDLAKARLWIKVE